MRSGIAGSPSSVRCAHRPGRPRGTAKTRRVFTAVYMGNETVNKIILASVIPPPRPVWGAGVVPGSASGLFGFYPEGKERHRERQAAPSPRPARAVPSPAGRLWRRALNPSCESLKIKINVFIPCGKGPGLSWIPGFQGLSLFCKKEKWQK